jgi:SAM-dependent methyltransferase
VELQAFADNLQLEDGIWRARSRSAVSYPDEGNQECFELEDSSFWFQHRNRCLATVVRQLPPSGALFDLGGGNGFVARGLEAAGFPTVVVEPGPEGARNARSRGLEHVVCATVQDAGFKPGSLPAIGVFDVVEHIQDDLAFLSLLKDLLVPEGRLYLTVPAFSWLWSSEDVVAGHFRRYTLGSMSERLRQAGLKVEFASYIFSVLPLPVFLARTLPTALRLRRPSSSAPRTRREHNAPAGLGTRIMNAIWNWELARLGRLRRIPLGGSCLVVARKLVT